MADGNFEKHKSDGSIGGNAWIGSTQRFPADVDVESAPFRVLRAEELQFLVLLRLAGVAGAGRSRS